MNTEITFAKDPRYAFQWNFGKSQCGFDSAAAVAAFIREELPGIEAMHIKPEPVPPGDLTWEEARALKDAGVAVQFYSTAFERWEDVIGVLEDRNHAWCIRDRVAFRRKPEPKRVPLGPEDVPPGSALYRSHGEPIDRRTWLSVLRVDFSGIYAVNNVGNVLIHSFDELAADPDSRITTDGGETWGPCWKEAS